MIRAERLEGNCRTVGAYLKVLDSGKLLCHGLGQCDLILYGELRQHRSIIKETRNSYNLSSLLRGRSRDEPVPLLLGQRHHREPADLYQGRGVKELLSLDRRQSLR